MYLDNGTFKESLMWYKQYYYYNSIITVKDVDYGCIIHSLSKSEAINLLKILFLMIMDIYKKYCL